MEDHHQKLLTSQGDNNTINTCFFFLKKNIKCIKIYSFIYIKWMFFKNCNNRKAEMYGIKTLLMCYLSDNDRLWPQYQEMIWEISDDMVLMT